MNLIGTDSAASAALNNAVSSAVATMPSAAAAAENSSSYADASRVPINVIDRKHPEWSTYAEEWDRLSTLYNAGPLLLAKSAELLWRRPKEPDDVFRARAKAITYTNILSAGLTWYQAKLFASDPPVDIKKGNEAIEPPDAETGKGGDPEFDYYERFFDNCDCCGTTLFDKFRDVFRQMLLFRRSYILLDLPVSVNDAETRAEQILEPYLSLFSARDAINWSCDDYGCLSWIVFYANAIDQSNFLGEPVTIRRWYYYDRTEFRVYEKRSDNQQLSTDGDQMATLVARGRHATSDYVNPADPDDIGRVPVICAELPESFWLGGRVYLQILDHFNTENALKWGLMCACLAMPVIKTEGEFKTTLSEAGMIKLRPGDEFGWTEPNGRSFEISAGRLDTLREEIYRMMYLQAQGRTSKATASSTSGYSKELDMAASRDVVNGFGKILRAVIQLTLSLVAGIRREDNLSFDVRGLNTQDDPALDDIVAAQQVGTLGIQSETFRKEIQKSVVRLMGNAWNKDLLQKICSEIDDAPTLEELQQQQQEQEQQMLEQKLSSAAGSLVQVSQRNNAKQAAD